MDLKAPFPYFGGKSKIAPTLWRAFGAVNNYVDPFCGSAAGLLSAPALPPVVTLNDADGLLVNFYRAVQAAPEAVAAWLDWPVAEIDLFARHVWLVERKADLAERLHCDPGYFDPQIAGWWCWGICAWIGTGWCAGDGPWTVQDGAVVHRQLPHLGNAGRGVHRQLPHLGDAGRGVHRKLPHLGDANVLMHRRHITSYMQDLAARLRTARITCGDWRRVVTPSVTTRHGLTAILLDPPYGEGAQEYAAGGNGDRQLARDVWAWAVANGDNPLLRIAVCAYADGRDLPPGWRALPWKARKGYRTSTANPHREIVYFSPHCLDLNALPLFAALEDGHA